jgi:hypothetical protein
MREETRVLLDKLVSSRRERWRPLDSHYGPMAINRAMIHIARRGLSVTMSAVFSESGNSDVWVFQAIVAGIVGAGRTPHAALLTACDRWNRECKPPPRVRVKAAKAAKKEKAAKAAKGRMAGVAAAAVRGVG